MAQANGVDSILLLEPSERADIRMRVLEKDGSESMMCGNGARVVSRFATAHFDIDCPVIEAGGKTFETFAREDGLISVNLGQVDFFGPDRCLVGGEPHRILTSNPGKKLLLQDTLRLNLNSNVLTGVTPDKVSIETFERGVNDFTKCCGTGSVAAANILNAAGMVEDEVLIISPGGSLSVEIDKKGRSWMTGAAEFV